MWLYFVLVPTGSKNVLWFDKNYRIINISIETSISNHSSLK